MAGNFRVPGNSGGQGGGNPKKKRRTSNARQQSSPAEPVSLPSMQSVNNGPGSSDLYPGPPFDEGAQMMSGGQGQPPTMVGQVNDPMNMPPGGGGAPGGMGMPFVNSGGMPMRHNNSPMHGGMHPSGPGGPIPPFPAGPIDGGGPPPPQHHMDPHGRVGPPPMAGGPPPFGGQEYNMPPLDRIGPMSPNAGGGGGHQRDRPPSANHLPVSQCQGGPILTANGQTMPMMGRPGTVPGPMHSPMGNSGAGDQMNGFGQPLPNGGPMVGGPGPADPFGGPPLASSSVVGASNAMVNSSPRPHDGGVPPGHMQMPLDGPPARGQPQSMPPDMGGPSTSPYPVPMGHPHPSHVHPMRHQGQPMMPGPPMDKMYIGPPMGGGMGPGMSNAGGPNGGPNGGRLMGPMPPCHSPGGGMMPGGGMQMMPSGPSHQSRSPCHPAMSPNPAAGMSPMYVAPPLSSPNGPPQNGMSPMCRNVGPPNGPQSPMHAVQGPGGPHDVIHRSGSPYSMPPQNNNGGPSRSPSMANGGGPGSNNASMVSPSNRPMSSASPHRQFLHPSHSSPQHSSPHSVPQGPHSGNSTPVHSQQNGPLTVPMGPHSGPGPGSAPAMVGSSPQPPFQPGPPMGPGPHSVGRLPPGPISPHMQPGHMMAGPPMHMPQGQGPPQLHPAGGPSMNGPSSQPSPMMEGGVIDGGPPQHHPQSQCEPQPQQQQQHPLPLRPRFGGPMGAGGPMPPPHGHQHLHGPGGGGIPNGPHHPPHSHMGGPSPQGSGGAGGGGGGGVPGSGPPAMFHPSVGGLSPLSTDKVYPAGQPMVFNPQNPNAPPIYPCGICHREVRDNDQAILCESGCNFWFHRVCTGLTHSAFHFLTQEIYAEWVCDKCFSQKDVPLVKFKP